jgi:hypothetical protein
MAGFGCPPRHKTIIVSRPHDFGGGLSDVDAVAFDLTSNAIIVTARDAKGNRMDLFTATASLGLALIANWSLNANDWSYGKSAGRHRRICSTDVHQSVFRNSTRSAFCSRVSSSLKN